MHNRPLPFDPALIERICATHETPFYLYHEDGISGRIRDLYEAFSWNDGFRQYFAVKATPNPHIVALAATHGCGADCSSVAELEICRRLGIDGDKVMFTSNNTTTAEFQTAVDLGAIVNLDAPHHIAQLEKLPTLPGAIAFRFNPGAERSGNVIIGDPKESKFGCTRDQLLSGYAECKSLGIQRFGLHAMIVSNELDVAALLDTAEMLFEFAVAINEKTGVRIEFVNVGGGIGVPYKPGQSEVDLKAYGNGVRLLYERIIAPSQLAPLKVYMENGRAITGPFGYLITRVLNIKDTYKRYVGVDATMANLMRPGMYGAYHHISGVEGVNQLPSREVDVVGSLCENNDKFAVNRMLPDVAVGDLLAIHDAGAHGHSMGFQYNGRLRCAEFLFDNVGNVRQIRRPETLEDYFATVDFASLSQTGE